MGSLTEPPEARAATVRYCVRSLVGQLTDTEFRLGTLTSLANDLTKKFERSITGDICVCVHEDHHLLDHLGFGQIAKIRSTKRDPKELGFECRQVFAEHADSYDLFCFVEDDTAILDPEFFRKIAAFHQHFGHDRIIMPNRYELAGQADGAWRAYLDQPAPQRYQIKPDAEDVATLSMPTYDGEIILEQTESVYAGSYVITTSQLRRWMAFDDFYQPDPALTAKMDVMEVGQVPLRGRLPVYKPAGKDMSFLEVHHVPDRASNARTPSRQIAALLAPELARRRAMSFAAPTSKPRSTAKGTRILVTIPHYWQAGNGFHGSLQADYKPRAASLARTLGALEMIFGSRHRGLNPITRRVDPANLADTGSRLDIVLCTTQGAHVLDHLDFPRGGFEHHEVDIEPKKLGFACHAVQRDRLGHYDWYAFMEDDLVLHDPWFLQKADWFVRQLGKDYVLQPNRYELSVGGDVCKLYIDGELAPKHTERYQNVADRPQIKAHVLGREVNFNRTLNPHSGSYFLNAEQMKHWTEQPCFLDYDCSFISPLESSASLGLMRTFRVYKPSLTNADFLEIEHGMNRYLGERIKITPDMTWHSAKI